MTTLIEIEMRPFQSVTSSRMVSGLARHIVTVATLRELLRQDTEFMWDECYDVAFHQIKQMITMDVTLRHYDIMLPVEIHVNASLRGLGAALVQDGKPNAIMA